MSKAIVAALKKAHLQIYRTLPEDMRVASAIVRIMGGAPVRTAGFRKKAYTAESINALINGELKKELRGSGHDLPNVNWGRLFFGIVGKYVKHQELPKQYMEEYLNDVVGDMVMGESLGARRHTGEWKHNLAQQVRMWLDAGKGDQDIAGLTGKWAKSKVKNLGARWKSLAQDEGFEMGQPSGEGEGGRAMYEGLFTMDAQSAGVMSNYMSLIRVNPDVRMQITRIHKNLMRRDDKMAHIWQAFTVNPTPSFEELLRTEIEAKDPLTGRPGKMPLFQALGYTEGDPSNRGKLQNQVKNLKKILHDMWPDVEEVLMEIE